MSYNVEHIKVLKLDAWILAKDLHSIVDSRAGDLPEINFIDDLESNHHRAAPNTRIPLDDFTWSGIGSGRCMDVLLQEIAPRINGVVEAVLVWEDGRQTGLKIRDGKVTKPKVRVALED